MSDRFAPPKGKGPVAPLHTSTQQKHHFPKVAYEWYSRVENSEEYKEIEMTEKNRKTNVIDFKTRQPITEASKENPTLSPVTLKYDSLSELSPKEQLLSMEQIQRTKVAIMTAKSACAFKSDRWLPLLSQAMSEIEQCPEKLRDALMKELCSLHPAWRKRPRVQKKTPEARNTLDKPTSPYEKTLHNQAGYPEK